MSDSGSREVRRMCLTRDLAGGSEGRMDPRNETLRGTETMIIKGERLTTR
jgi:hypothetical protein